MSNAAVLLDIKWDIGDQYGIFYDALKDFSVVNWSKETDRALALDEVKYAVVWKPEPGLLARCTNLEVIFSLGAGVDHVFSDPELPDLPIVRFVDPNLTGPMVEWVVLQVLLHLRQQRAYDGLQRKHEWRELPQPPAKDLRVGIMGLGELGQACARALIPFGFQLNGWSRSEKAMGGVRCFHGDDGLEKFLTATDILVSLLPLTEETRGILSADLINKLATDGPFGAPVLINAGRGGSQVEADIVAALEDGRLLSASLDVFETEPLPENSPLWDLDNLIITPHAAAVSDPAALAAHVVRQIRRHESGAKLEHLVDRSRGY